MQWYDYYLYFWAGLMVIGMAVTFYKVDRKQEPTSLNTAIVTGIFGVIALTAILLKLGEG